MKKYENANEVIDELKKIVNDYLRESQRLFDQLKAQQEAEKLHQSSVNPVTMPIENEE